MRPSPSLIAMQALQFRTSMAVVEVLRLKSGEEFPICPRCHISLEREYMNFCDRCGQKLCWHDFRHAKVIHPSFPSI